VASATFYHWYDFHCCWFVVQMASILTACYTTSLPPEAQHYLFVQMLVHAAHDPHMDAAACSNMRLSCIFTHGERYERYVAATFIVLHLEGKSRNCVTNPGQLAGCSLPCMFVLNKHRMLGSPEVVYEKGLNMMSLHWHRQLQYNILYVQ